MSSNSSNSSSGGVTLNPPLDSSELDSEEFSSNRPKKQPSPAKRWCFTWHNFPTDWKDTVERAKPLLAVYTIGVEVGEKTHREHLQGYLEFITKRRPTELGWPSHVHFEICRGNRASNLIYCSKEGQYIANIKMPRPLQLITELYPWQQEIVDLVSTIPNDRTIHWFWDRNGNVGKSALVKLLCAKYGAIVCAGKAADMKFQIAEALKKGEPPDIVIFDIPRTSLDYISYTGIEEIKNGCFASSKYESGMVLMNSPHILIFANREPDYTAMSADRWLVKEL